ncbi:MAG: hypothetical protein Q4C71_01835 [Microbacteriaceae bacterium]|nr:hypothetical protein [Microbacteriaceae bacterium]
MQEHEKWEPVEFKHIWIGHLIGGSFLGIFVFLTSGLCLWLLGRGVAAGALATILFICIFTIETLSALYDRHHSIKHQHLSPGGWSPVILRICLLVILYGTVSFIFTQNLQDCLIITGSAFLIESLSVYVFKTWQPGIMKSRAEARQAWIDTAAMTKEMTNK